jgi:two-component system OmpR family sensor kinase
MGLIGAANAKRLRRINVAARTVSTLYEDLKFATLEQNRETEDTVLDMRALIVGRLEFFEILMESKRLTLETHVSEAKLTADRRLVERVVDNLLSNAIKYNRRGGTIRVALRPGELVIQDTGVGIAPDVLPMIFERYARFNESKGGFGIGLSIVRRIVDHYGMTIAAQSQQGQGTTMTLHWQAKQSRSLPTPSIQEEMI